MNINDDRAPRSWLHIGFCITAIGFNLCLIVQLLTVGVAYFVDLDWWTLPRWLVRGYAGLALRAFISICIPRSRFGLRRGAQH